jgi:hypothetical protein
MTAPKTTPKPDATATAQTLVALVDADLPGTLAILAGILESIREGAKPEFIHDARYGTDALRLECDRWRKTDRTPRDAARALAEAGKAAAAAKK